jgi:hypothetical protein
MIHAHLTSRNDLVQYLKSWQSVRVSGDCPFARLACASSTLTASARDTKRGLAGWLTLTPACRA